MSVPTAPPEEGDNVIRSPELPFVSSIVGGISAGRAVVISGMVLPGYATDFKKFDVDLCCGLLIDGDHMDNKALHINPRFEKKGGWFSGAADDKLIINSYVSGRWGAEERFDNPFEEGKPFHLRILVLEKYFKITASGKHLCDFPHKVPISDIRTISIKGNVRVDYVEFQPSVNGTPGADPEEPREVLTKINRPEMPFSLSLPVGGFVSPQSLKFTVTPLLSADRFTINLMCKDEFLFHFRVDMPNTSNKIQAAVVRNSTKDGVRWQKEERVIGNFPFHKGITHDIVFTAYGKSVAVDVDGQPLTKFMYRDGDSPTDVDSITVIGDVILHRFEHRA